MKTYDEKEPCAKCGSKKKELRFIDWICSSDFPEGASALEVKCGLCGHEWKRLPLDHGEGEKESPADAGKRGFDDAISQDEKD